MQMIKTVTVLILVSIAATAALALISFGSNHAWAMRKYDVFTGSSEQHMSQGSHMNFDENLSTRMNTTGHMFESMPHKCEDPHDPNNMTQHMMGSH